MFDASNVIDGKLADGLTLTGINSPQNIFYHTK